MLKKPKTILICSKCSHEVSVNAKPVPMTGTQKETCAICGRRGWCGKYIVEATADGQ